MVKLTQHLNALDMDGDGKVDIKDFLALFSSGQKEKPALPNLETLVSEAWGRNNKDLDKLSNVTFIIGAPRFESEIISELEEKVGKKLKEDKKLTKSLGFPVYET